MGSSPTNPLLAFDFLSLLTNPSLDDSEDGRVVIARQGGRGATIRGTRKGKRKGACIYDIPALSTPGKRCIPRRRLGELLTRTTIMYICEQGTTSSITCVAFSAESGHVGAGHG